MATIDIEAQLRSAGVVAVGGTATGEITPTGDPNAPDHDWFAVELEAGKTYVIEVKGAWTGDGTLYDPALVGLYDKDGTFVAGTGANNGGWGTNSAKIFVPVTSGTYYVAAGADGPRTGTYTVAVNEVEDDFAASTATTGTVAVGGTATGKIDAPADSDWFAVELEAGKTYRIEVRGKDSGDGTQVDPVLVGLYDKDGAFVAGTGDDDSGAGRNALKAFTPAASGTYYVAAGVDGPRTGTYTVAVAEEAEDDFAASTATTGTVAVGGTATGEITLKADPRTLDHDWFAVELEAGKTYRIEVRGAGSGDGTLADPVLVGLYDKDGAFVSGTGDDDSGTGTNSLKLFAPAASGTYYVAAGADGTGAGTYTVAVDEVEDDFAASTATVGTVAVGGTATGEIGVFPVGRDHDWFAVELKAGKTYVIEVRGAWTGDGTLRDPVLVGLYDKDGVFVPGTGDDNSGSFFNSVTVFVPTASGTYHVAARAHGSDTGTYTVAVTQVQGDDFVNSPATSGTVAVGGTATGEIDAEFDRDWFAVDLEAGKSYRIEVRGAETGDGTLADPVLAGLYDKDGALVAGTGDDDSGTGTNSLKLFTPVASGTYHVAVQGHISGTGTYTVAVAEEAEDDLAASTATTGTVAVGGTATGEIDRGSDHDWFAVELEAGRVYRIEVRGAMTGEGTLYDPVLVGLYDKDGALIAGTGDDDSGRGANAREFFAAEASGTYYVAARSHDPYTGTYTVAVNEVPDDFAASVSTTGTVAVGDTATGKIDYLYIERDRDWFAVDLEAGKSYRIEVRGKDTGDGTLADPILVGLYDKDGAFIPGTGEDNLFAVAGRNSLKAFMPDATGTYFVAVRGPGLAMGTYTVAVAETDADHAASTATTGTVAVGGTAAGEVGVLANGRDHDWFAVDLEAGKTYVIEVRGKDTGDGTLGDPVLMGLYDKDGAFIAGTGNDDGGEGRNGLRVFAPDTSGTYYVAVGAHVHGARIGTGTYTVAVTEEVPEDDHAASATLALMEMDAIRVLEGGTAAFTVRLSEAAAGEVTVQWSIGGTVTAGDDYTGTAGPFTLTFAAGETEKTVEIRTLDDTVDEGDETLTVTLSNPSGATLGTTVSATVTIADDDSSGMDTTQVETVVPVNPVGQPQEDSQLGPTPSGGLVLRGTEGADTIVGTDAGDHIEGLGGADTLHGGRGDDVLVGRSGDDVLHGGKGVDKLRGGRGDDVLYGGDGKDRLEGGRGDDVLHGGVGADRFVYDEGPFGRDRIADFEDGKDVIKFHGLQWSDLTIGSNAAGDAVVRVTGTDSRIVLEGVDASLIGQDDFLFA